MESTVYAARLDTCTGMIYERIVAPQFARRATLLDVDEMFFATTRDYVDISRRTDVPARLSSSVITLPCDARECKI